MNMNTKRPVMRYARRDDLPAILKVEWEAFEGQYEFRYTAGELLRTYKRYPKAFRVAETQDRGIVGYTCAIFLTDQGSRRLFEGEVDALQDMTADDITAGGVCPSKHLHLEVLATLDPTDVVTAALLIRDLLSVQAAEALGIVRYVTAEGIKPAGHRLLRKAGFEPYRQPHRWPDGTISRLYFLDLTSPQGRHVAIRFGLISPDEAASIFSTEPETYQQHAWMLDAGRHCVETGDLDRAIEVLSEYCRHVLSDPRSWALLGVANDLFARRKSAVHCYQRALDLYGALQQDTPYAWLNMGIIYDRLGRAEDLDRILRTPEQVPDMDADFWFKLGFLYVRVNRFADALACFKKVIDKRGEDVATLIRMGYCYEGLEQFDKAIECIHKARLIMTKHTILDAEGYEAEMTHALGHFYSSRFVTSRNTQDRDLAVKWMKASAERSPVFRLCLGVVYTETEFYDRAIKLLSEVIHDASIQSNPHIHNEAYLYRGEAFAGCGLIDDAIRDFGIYSSFCRQHDNRDGIATANLYIVRARLRRYASIQDLSLDDVRHLKSLLENHRPSRYAVPNLRQVHERYIDLLDGIIAVKQSVSDPHSIERAVESLHKAIGHEEQLELLVLADHRLDECQRYFPPYVCLVACPNREVDVAQAEALCRKYNVWLAHFRTNISELQWKFMGDYHTSKVIFVLDERGIGGIHLQRAILVRSIDDAALMCTFMLLYERITEYLNRPIPVLGLTPESGAPTVAFQRTNFPWATDTLMPLEHELEPWQLH